jgi:hypothetical protein
MASPIVKQKAWLEGKCERLKRSLKAANARIEILTDALRPFAVACTCNTAGIDHDDLILRVPLTVGELRKANAAIATPPQTPRKGRAGR